MCRTHIVHSAVAAGCSEGVEVTAWNEISVGSDGVSWTVVPRDAAVSGYWELIVAGVEKVVMREAGRHTQKVIERRDERTVIT